MDATAKNNALYRFRIIALTEGISFIVLLGIAMPLKYLAGYPMAVKVVGWLHGVLFVLYILSLLQAAWLNRWSLWKTFLAFVASLIPLGTFYLDYHLKKESIALTAGNNI